MTKHVSRPYHAGTTALALSALAISISGVFQTSVCYGSTEKSLSVGGVTRTYYVYLPSSYSSSVKVPVVFVLHPLDTDAAWAETNMAWDQCADKNNFIVVYGQSATSLGTWNAGITPGEIATGVDDVSYVEAVMDAVEDSYAVDLSHVYMVGSSAGAFMTAKMAVTIPGSITAIATVEGMTGFADKDLLVPSAPISAIMFRGTADPVVPYSSDEISKFFHSQVYSATGTASDWAQADGCSLTPAVSKIDSGKIIVTDYTGGTDGAEVRLMTVNGGKHEYLPEDTGLIWQFFASQTKTTSKP